MALIHYKPKSVTVLIWPQVLPLNQIINHTLFTLGKIVRFELKFYIDFALVNIFN